MFIDVLYGFYTPLFDADNGGADGGNSGEDQGGKDGDNSDQGGSEGGKKKFEFTPEQQAEIDRIVAERVARERKKFADYEQLKSKLAEYEKAEEERKKAQMTETERLKAEKEEALKKVEEAENKSAEALRRANERLIRAEFRLLAKEAGIRADALDDAYKLADFSDVEVDDDGNVKGVDKVVKALAQNKPYLVEQPKQKPKQIGEPSNHSVDDEVKTLEAQLEEAKKAKDFSKVVELSNKIKAKLAGK